MSLRLVCLALVSFVPVWCGSFCEPAPQVRAGIEKIQPVSGIDPWDFDRNVAPFLELRDRHADDLFAHERYQDAVHQGGIEGHLRSLTQEYQILAIQHSGDLMYRYLHVRTLIGRTTPFAMERLNEILAENPAFAPGHRMLAEVYASEGFHDVERAKTERDIFLALCPGSVLTRRPGPLDDPSPLVERAERLLAANGDPDRIAAMALAGISNDEWRLQRVRPFDWYSVDFKRQLQREVQSTYWRVWGIQVRCYRKAGQDEKAAELLSQMEERSQRLQSWESWDAFALLAQLYTEGNQVEPASQKLEQMGRLLEEHPDPNRAAKLEQLRELIGGK